MRSKRFYGVIALIISASVFFGAGEAVLAAGSGAETSVSVQSQRSAVDSYLSRAAGFINKKVTSPSVGSIGGEWAVLGLSRSDYSVPDGYFEGYISRAGDYVTEKKGILSSRKYTEYSRLILALTSLGVDARDFRGYDLTLPLGDFDATIKQGTNGAVFALLALDSGNYPMPENPDATVQATRSMYVDLILSRQNSDGGWSVTFSDNDRSDADMTAMALQSLANYVSRDDVKAAVDAGFSYLSKAQLADGGFSSNGAENCESVSQVIIALAAHGKKPDDPDFVKNGKTPLDALKTFQTPDGGFLHTAESKSSNLMASEQALCALSAAKRAESGGKSFYDMSDALSVSEDFSKFPGRDDEVKKREVGEKVTFSDVPESDAGFSAISELSARGIINGRGGGLFAPDGQMTRSEFCAIVVRALGFAADGKSASELDFSDIPESDWAYSYVKKAASKGIVNGIGGGLFAPSGTITRETAAVMVCRAAKLCGLDTTLSERAVIDILSQFSDYRKSSDWAREGLAVCVNYGILDESEILLRPSDAITRREVAMMLYELLERAELL